MPEKENKPKKKRGPIPNAPKPGRPGHNGGGWLLSGNTKNVGRKSAAVRASILQTVDDSVGLMRSILDGEFKVENRDMFGNVVGYRSATIKEAIAAFEVLAKHALPTKQEVSGPDGGPIPIENTTPDIDGFLDKCSPEDLELLRGVAARVHADPDS